MTIIRIPLLLIIALVRRKEGRFDNFATTANISAVYNTNIKIASDNESPIRMSSFFDFSPCAKAGAFFGHTPVTARQPVPF